MKLVTQVTLAFLSTACHALPPSNQDTLQVTSKSCPDLSNWTQGKKQKNYSNAKGTTVYKYLTTTSAKVAYPYADAQCEEEFGGYVVSANIIDEDQNDYVFGHNSPLNPSNQYWFNSFMSTFGVDGKNGGGGCDGTHLCWQSWRRCKEGSDGQQCTPTNSNVEFNHYFVHPHWDDDAKKCAGQDATGRNTCNCLNYMIDQPPTTVSVFASEGYNPAFVYQKSSGKTVWGCETSNKSTKRQVMCEVLCGEDGKQYKNNDPDNWA